MIIKGDNDVHGELGSAVGFAALGAFPVPGDAEMDAGLPFWMTGVYVAPGCLGDLVESDEGAEDELPDSASSHAVLRSWPVGVGCFLTATNGRVASVGFSRSCRAERGLVSGLLALQPDASLSTNDHGVYVSETIGDAGVMVTKTASAIDMGEHKFPDVTAKFPPKFDDESHFLFALKRENVEKAVMVGRVEWGESIIFGVPKTTGETGSVDRPIVLMGSNGVPAATIAMPVEFETKKAHERLERLRDGARSAYLGNMRRGVADKADRELAADYMERLKGDD